MFLQRVEWLGGVLVLVQSMNKGERQLQHVFARRTLPVFILVVVMFKFPTSRQFPTVDCVLSTLIHNCSHQVHTHAHKKTTTSSAKTTTVRVGLDLIALNRDCPASNYYRQQGALLALKPTSYRVVLSY